MPTETVNITLELYDFYNIINAMRDMCGCATCERVTNLMIEQKRGAR